MAFCALFAGEIRGPLLEESGDAFQEVFGVEQLHLAARFDVERFGDEVGLARKQHPRLAAGEREVRGDRLRQRRRRDREVSRLPGDRV